MGWNIPRKSHISHTPHLTLLNVVFQFSGLKPGPFEDEGSCEIIPQGIHNQQNREGAYYPTQAPNSSAQKLLVDCLDVE